jgi:hypothetical protein
MKIVIMTTMYKRHHLTNYVFSHYNKLKDEFKDIAELIFVVGGSEGETSKKIAEKNNFHYIETPNDPLSKKHNNVLMECKKFNPDAVVLVGSDDVMSKEVIFEYIKGVIQEIEFIGFTDLYFYDKNLFYFSGYDANVKNMTLGAGRFFSKSLLDKINWNLWGDIPYNKGLDAISYNKIKLLSPSSKILRLVDIDGLILDIKSTQNVTNIDYIKNKKKIDINYLNKFDINISEINNVINVNNKKEDTIVDFYDLSILISTYKNVQYFDECINSIIESIGNKNVEILIGVDSCKETFAHIQNREYPNYIKFFFFERNVGPYVVFNSLSTVVKSSNLMFFGSDDIMDKNMVDDFISALQKYECVIPTFINFNNGEIIDKNSKRFLGEGVIGIKKPLFEKMNGYENWMCAADTDFMVRLQKYRPRMSYTNKINFYRRIHDQGLTSRKETGFGSPMRLANNKITFTRKSIGAIPTMVIEPFEMIETKKFYVNRNVKLNHNKNKIGDILSRNNNSNIEIKEINYEKVNQVVQNRQTQKPQPKPQVTNENPNSNANTAKNASISKKPIKPDSKNKIGKDFLRI